MIDPFQRFDYLSLPACETVEWILVDLRCRRCSTSLLPRLCMYPWLRELWGGQMWTRIKTSQLTIHKSQQTEYSGNWIKWFSRFMSLYSRCRSVFKKDCYRIPPKSTQKGQIGWYAIAVFFKNVSTSRV